MQEDLAKELERTREDLEDIEMYLQEYNAFLPLAVCSINPVGVVISVNSAFEDVTGYGALDATGKKIEDFFVETKTVGEFLSTKKESKKFTESQQITLLSKNYGKRTVNLTASTRSSHDGEFIGFFVGINDITELKDLQDRLEDKVVDQTKDLLERTEELERSRSEIMLALSKVEEERNKTFSLVMNLSDGLIYTDTDGVIEMINPQAETILKADHTEVLRTNVYQSKVSDRFQKLSSSLSKERGLERETVEFSGDLVVEVSTVSVNNDKGELAGRVIVLHDISKDRALDNLKVEFISVAAHQMRTPLAAIKWAFEILLSSDDEKIAPELKKIVENGFESTNRILKIVNNFLDVDAAESMNSDYVFAPVNVQKVIEDVFSGVSIAARGKNIELVFENQDQVLPYVQADQERLGMIMQNLIENALKYTIDEGTITVKVEARPRDLLISVSDEGIGIPVVEQKNIFSKFFRAENAKKTETDGNGLGLHTTKRVVERHGGTIWFESVEGQGTTFYFTIPLYNK
ncbi:MAG: ATP-binding protein [Candidatus Paceibacterota bacterium]